MPKLREGWKPNKLCKVCNLVKGGDEELWTRIAGCKQYVRGGESLRSIADAYVDKFEYQSLRRHAIKHQAPSGAALAIRRVNDLQLQQQSENYQKVVKTIDARSKLITILDEVTQNHEEFKSLPIDKKIALLLRALKDEDDVKGKEKDQEIDILKMMMPSRSGESVLEAEEAEEFDPWKGQ